jgi:hypothetical protein
MKYMLLIYGDEKAWTQSEREDCYEESLHLVQQLRASRQYLSSAPLHSVTTVTSIQRRDGKKFVTDRPFPVPSIATVPSPTPATSNSLPSAPTDDPLTEPLCFGAF